MSRSAGRPQRRALATFLAWLIAGSALLAVVIFEFSPGAELRGDGDNPSDSLRYLIVAGRAYLLSGAMLALGAAALVVGAVGRWNGPGERPESMVARVGLAFTAVSATLLIGAGVLRMQATGTVPHIAELDPEWGDAAYLAVQMAGTQGMLSAGMVLLLVVSLLLSSSAWSRGVRAPLVAATLPAIALLFLLGDLIVPGFASIVSDGMFLVYAISAAVGAPLWCIVYGVSMYVADRREGPGSPSPAAVAPVGV